MSQTEDLPTTGSSPAPTDDPSGQPLYLVGVDASEPSRRAVEFAAAEATATGGRLILVHVIDWSPYSFTSVQENERRPQEEKQEIARAEKGMAPLVERAAELGADVATIIRHGHPAQTIVQLCQQHHATHVVVGRTGESRLRSLLFGSTPSHLIQVSAVPVTVVP